MGEGHGSPMDRVLNSGSEGPGFDTRCQIKTHRVHWDRRTHKICGSKVPTVRAYDVAEMYRWMPAQVSTSSLDRGSKIRGVIGCVKAPHGG